MFESLKKKLKTWLNVEEPKKKTKKEKVAKSKVKAKKDKPKETKPVVSEVEVSDEPEKKGFFSRLTSKIGATKINEETFDELFYELELILLENNVALEVVDAIREGLKKELMGKEVSRSELQKTVLASLKETISSILKEPPSLLDQIRAKKEPYVIVFCGINGAGKTTTLAKVAYWLKKNKISSVIAAGDTFRAASIEQLEQHGAKLDVKVIKQAYGADPAAVGFDAKKYAEAHNIKVVLIDTAGRMYTKENLMKEMEKIIRVTKPDLTLFVGESITGNDATEQARTFSQAIPIDGMILTKADVDDKGGTALSVSYVTQKPIYFLGMGQTYDDLKPFKKQDILNHLGLG